MNRQRVRAAGARAERVCSGRHFVQCLPEWNELFLLDATRARAGKSNLH